MLEEIAKGEDGYQGGITLVRDYLRTIRPARGRVYHEVFYEPGEALQVDWGECQPAANRRHIAPRFGAGRRVVLQPAVLHRIQLVRDARPISIGASSMP